ncbi:SpvB/TcaC N-terminal domain-containing protein [Mycolicibacterium sp.]|uniref:SpvB/TcaC N-terminal domain-containing protein n=1 Tax=Mycolicibacterium sp. TaxID=2320850 RepID=UPI0028B05A1E|nr:SpvB/TcaC N-terminal domain-containing protein [Mycolicibacterium sp.]
MSEPTSAAKADLADKNTTAIVAPNLSLPRGGGAIRGIGEKFTANPVTGTAAMTVPVWTSPGRGGFGPTLALSYDSGSGNGPFGLGWSLPLPTVTRRTDKGVPLYDDAGESDVFILSGAEDLVPVLEPDGRRRRDEETAPGYFIDRYRPRIEGLFARIERWTNRTDGSVHWRSLSRENVVTLYGGDTASRISHPGDPSQVFSWLISESRDDRGNAIVYEYKAENADAVDLTLPSQRNRGVREDRARAVNRYIKRIRYGNRHPILNAGGSRPWLLTDLPAAVRQNIEWMFEVVFDYGEHDHAAPPPDEHGAWDLRSDPFSTYRAGFECRTNRRCRRVLMFHHVPDEPGGTRGYDGVVRSTDLTYTEPIGQQAGSAAYSTLAAVTQTGYRRNAIGAYDTRSMPPVEFTYTMPEVHQQVEQVDPRNLEHLPIGVDGTTYRWIDLHGDGIPGILTEQGHAWFYTRNVTPAADNDVRFEPTELVGVYPTATLNVDKARFMDLAGDGQPDLVMLAPSPGFFEHDEDEGWKPFRPFTSALDFDLNARDVTFVDLDGDGHADVLIAEDDAWAWHPSLGENGFGARRRVAAALDDERGPRAVAAGSAEALVLADLSGDGLSDLVRIRNGEICYWPNLGHGRFGAKVTMDCSPQLDNPDTFDPARVRLADIDGSGTTDIIYLHRDGVRLYFNLSGNGWSDPKTLTVTPQVDNLTSVEVTDLLGNGTACLVWSSSQSGRDRQPIKFVNLMGADKPHLLVGTSNNLGTDTEVHYRPSTHFSLTDRRGGRPWRTRLPFPVHVVASVVTRDLIGRATFTTQYAYHDGFFDGDEREFRGFGLVEAWDTDEVIDRGDNAVAASLRSAPVHTKTWYHNGSTRGCDWRGAFAEPGLSPEETAARRLPDNLLPDPLDDIDRRELCRSLKGLMLRQEVFGRDGSAKERVPYVVTDHRYEVRRLQPRGGNHHGVYLSHLSQTLTTNYERSATDPRVTHGMTLEVDRYGTVTKRAEIAYSRRRTIRVLSPGGRRSDVPNAALVALAPSEQSVQTRPLLTYSEMALTNAVDDIAARPDDFRLPRSCQTRSYQLTGFDATGPDGRFQATDLVEPDPGHPGLVRSRASQALRYEQDTPPGMQRRLVEHSCTVFRADDLSSLLPLGRLEARGLTGQTYTLAFTAGLIDAVYQRVVTPLTRHDDPLFSSVDGDGGGYLAGATLKARHDFPDDVGDDDWWIPSGLVFLSADLDVDAAAELDDAVGHFFLPRRYRDPFGHDTLVRYDSHDLVVVQTTDPVGNSATVDTCDYRLLQPQELTNANGNRAAVAFDVLGMVAGTAAMGKRPPSPVEGDVLTDFAADVSQDQLDAFQSAADPHEQAPTLLGSATTRIIYDLNRFRISRASAPDNLEAWQPVYTVTLARDTHLSEALDGEPLGIQMSFDYSDGFGRVIQKKIQAEPGPVTVGGPTVDPRWVGSGWTIFNNKGSPVRQYEPFFSQLSKGHQFEYGRLHGVSPVLFHDPTQRVVAALNPNHTYTKVVFGAWHTATFDVNDTSAPRNGQTGDPRTDIDIGAFVKPYLDGIDSDPAEPWATWYQQRITGALGTSARAAAEQTSAHADTPTVVHLDPLGRPVLTVLHNRVADPLHPLNGLDETLEHRIELDVDGNKLAVRDGVTDAWDAAGNPASDRPGRLVTRTTYDLLGHPVREESMDAGTRWTLLDVAAKVIRRWDSRGHCRRSAHDALRRPTHEFVAGTDAGDPEHEVLTERMVYGEQHPDGALHNLRGTVCLHLDQAGTLANVGHDFKGNPVGAIRRFTSQTQYRGVVDWAPIDAQLPADPKALLDLGSLDDALAEHLEDIAYASHSTYDALDRPRELITPHGPASSASVIRNAYNAANLLDRVDVNVQSATVGGQPQWTPVITNIDYDAKGQRQRVERGNGAATDLEYDPLTFQLVRLKTRRDSAVFPDDCIQPPPVGWPGCGVQDIAFTYDAAGNPTRITDAAQQRIFFANRRVEPDTTYVYDATYQVISATGREHLGQAADAPSRAGDPGKVGVAWGANDGTAMGAYVEHYSYDRAGNLTELHHKSSDAAFSWTRTFNCDAVSALEDGASGLRRHGNRLTDTTVANAPSETLEYDEHGNVVRMTHLGDGGPTPNMHWNHLDQLVRIDHGGGGTTYYVYDASGRRIRTVREKSATLTEERIDLGDVDIFRKRQGADVLERETIHVRDATNRIALIESRTIDTVGGDPAPARLVRFQLADHLSSSHVELDESARIISYEEYAPFGATTYQAVRSQTETPKRYRYTGHERDDETGFDAMGVRYYASWLCRWISCDPSGTTDSTNLYEYVANNPVRHVDVTGRGLWDKAKSFVSEGANRAVAAVKPGGAVFEAVDNAFKPEAHPVAAAVLNNMAKRGEGMVQGTNEMLKQAGNDYGDIAYAATHISEKGAKQKLDAAIDRRQKAPVQMAVGMVKGFGGMVKNVGNAIGDVAYYRPEFVGLGGVLKSHAHEQGADAKVASAITDIVLDGPQIVLAVEGGVNLAKGAAGALRKPPVPKQRGAPPVMRSSNELAGVETASQELIEEISKRRDVTWAEPGSEEMRYLDAIGAEASAGGDKFILLRRNPSKAAALEEFLHGTQSRLGIIDRLGRAGAETHVKDFMIRHKKLLGLGGEDVSRLQKLKDMGL